uniref:ORF2 n=1 Tax=Plasmopara viticola lesion associated sobemo-like 1 TaxID=2692075 RepID=A0A6B9Q478_9VIRU|nr:ORF2 [Plasmopara viticola lesion associated sobemo-like 1]
MANLIFQFGLWLVKDLYHLVLVGLSLFLVYSNIPSWLAIKWYIASWWTKAKLYYYGYRPATLGWVVGTYKDAFGPPESMLWTFEQFITLLFMFLGFLWVAINFCRLSKVVWSLLRLVFLRYKQDVAGFTTFVGEKMMPGSILEDNVPIPSFQAEVHIQRGCLFYKSGQGFQVGTYFYTANHVIEDTSEIEIRTVKDKLRMGIERFSLVEGDVARAELTAAESAKLGLKQAKLMTKAVEVNSGLFVKAVAFGKQSMGMLERHSAFGFVNYAGSTIKGFSGAPYFVGNTIYGMHVGTGVSNLGYEAAYIDMLHKRRSEDSDDWLVDQALSGAKYEYQQSPYDPDEYRVKIKGKYHIVDEDTLGKMTAGKGGKRVEKFSDLEFESLEVPVPVEELPLAPRGAVNHVDSENLMAPQVAPVGEAGQLKELLQGVLNQLEQEPKGTNSICQPSTESSHLNGPTSTPVQQKEALPSTSSDSKKHDELRTRQADSKRVTALLQQLALIRDGKRTSPRVRTVISSLISSLELQFKN